jgi:hypothetical protein
MDIFIGLSSGTSISWVNYRGDFPVKPQEPDIGGFFLREFIGIRFFLTDLVYIGARVFPSDMILFLADKGSGIGLLKLGAGLKF